MSASVGLPVNSIAAKAWVPLWAVCVREFRAARLNGFVWVFSFLALAGGIASVTLNEETGAAAFFLLQIGLYVVTLFAVLVGVSSARAEAEEWPILFAQPVPRWTVVTGKFAALVIIFIGILALLFSPAFFTEGAWATLGRQFFQTVMLSAVFGAIGLGSGILANDRVQGLIISVSLWLLLLFGLDMIAVFAAQWAPLQKIPDLWVAMLMFNPVDAFRIQALFALEQIPPEAADKTPLAHWWLTHAGLWVTTLSCAIVVGLILITNRYLRRIDL